LGLENVCNAVYTYERKKIYRSLPLSRPFIVQSRINDDLIRGLNADNHPVLLEGLHCSGVLPFIHNPKRAILRMHNEEASYYHYLAQSETSFLKKQYFFQESKLLKQYQATLNKEVKLACLSASDMDIFKSEYHFRNIDFIPCFIPWQQLKNKDGHGDYCLYHGNMSVSENEEAAQWLIQHVFSKIRSPLYIAGKGISNRLKKIAAGWENIRLINQPTIAEIDELIQNAHINVLPSMNSTGVKLKLLNALLNGRYCITNKNGVKGSKINSGLFIEDDPLEWIELIEKTTKQEFTLQEMAKRQEILALYNNQQNAATLSALW
jgi:hypothetical protein